MDLARQLLSQITIDELDITRFHDTFEEELQQLVAKKARGETISVQKIEYHATAEENLVEALKASLK